MKIVVKDIEKSQKEIIVTLTPKEMEPFLEEASIYLSKSLRVKGFRDGKIPRSIVENKLGKDKIWQEAANSAIEKNYFKVLKKKEIKAMGRPHIDILKLTPENDFEFKAKVPVTPFIDLPDYKIISTKILKNEIREIKVSDKEIQDALKWLQGSRMSVGEKEKKSEPPKIDDAFAQSIGNFKNLQELKKSMREGIRKEKKEKEKQRIRLKILEEINKKVNVQISDLLIEQELDKMQEELSSQTSSMGISLEQYLKNIKKSLEEIRKGWHNKAKERIISSIILNQIAEKEHILAPQGEVENEINKYLQHFQTSGEAKKNIDPESLRMYISGIIRNEKVFNFLEKN